jgi:hypothetical protein
MVAHRVANLPDDSYALRSAISTASSKVATPLGTLLKTVNDLSNSFAPLPAVFPNKIAPVMRYGADGKYGW